MENFDDKYKKKNPFTVPEGYFDELTGRITGRIEKQKEVKKSSSLRGLKPYMGLVAIFFLALMVVQILFPGAKNTDLPDIEGENAIVQEMEAEDIFDSQFEEYNFDCVAVVEWGGRMGSGQIDRRETERIRCAESRFLYTGIGPFPC